jgi:hypothetical protein
MGGDKTAAEPVEGWQSSPGLEPQGPPSTVAPIVPKITPPIYSSLLKGSDVDRQLLPTSYISPLIGSKTYFTPRHDTALLSTLNGLPLLKNEYGHLVDRVAMLQEEALHWREYVMQLQQCGARLAASESQAQSNLKVAQAELAKQGLTLQSTEGQLNMVKDELHTLFTRFQQREEQLTTQNTRLMSERDSSRAENDKLKVELQQLKQHSANQAEVIAARERELVLRNDERVKLLADNNQLQGRAQFAETELLKTTASLNKTKENLVFTDTELQKCKMALGDTSAREMSLQTKLNQVENECQIWMTHAKVHQEAEEARFRSAAYLGSVRVPTPFAPMPLVTTPLVTTPLSIYSTNYTSITRARLEEAKALERLQAARGNWIADGGRVSPKI